MSTTSSTPGVDRPVLPPVDLERMVELSRFLQQHESPAVLVGPDGDQVPLPLEVYQFLEQVARAMSEGKAITIAPLGQRLTTQQAADLLGISRPTLIKLLDEHEIPYERPGNGRHRRLRLRDVLDYRDRRRVGHRRRLAEMTRQAAEDGLYETSADDYREAWEREREEKS
ncbi:excisionase family DNA-binding protein [Nocardiopsis dassonvillei]|uniref:excisionase family DNA-binding protein n=1 Tax=Nocardiopsis dassonvillei TaxID=2014 RepID=UPI0033D4F492